MDVLIEEWMTDIWGVGEVSLGSILSYRGITPAPTREFVEFSQYIRRFFPTWNIEVKRIPYITEDREQLVQYLDLIGVRFSVYFNMTVVIDADRKLWDICRLVCSMRDCDHNILNMPKPIPTVTTF